MGCDAGECADCGRFSRGGEVSKHSCGDINEDGTEAPLPNLKGGHSTRADFNEREIVVEPLLRDRDGRMRLGLRRLKEMSEW